ncbi:hypothetical protein BT96DRAFT_110689 [Gymnopus androsaceus JB14]|uniref:F-box domain-containing protein n=1 Tax=Gymnopus androsaceus JB14 TaxID=1447944 RepID=A0A6A4HF53_9AGAR|nr:hypothetical protein BT96DRAFT_110689 [Gymnopus androsaceus JB14]
MNEAPESSPQQTVTVPLNKDLSDLIPFEIFEYIISLLPNHLPTLKNCTLTCRAWLQPSWKRLFAGRIVLVHRKNIDRLLEIIERNAHSDSLTIIRFIERVAIEQGGSSRLIRNEGNQERMT